MRSAISFSCATVWYLGWRETGQLLNVFPPFCTKESADGVTLRAIPVADRLGFLASLAEQIADLADGTPVEFQVKP